MEAALTMHRSLGSVPQVRSGGTEFWRMPTRTAMQAAPAEKPGTHHPASAHSGPHATPARFTGLSAVGAIMERPPFITLRGPDVNDRRPLQCSVELEATVRAVSRARMRTRQVLLEWGLERLSECAELLVSELATNAVTASLSLPAAHRVWLFLVSDSAQILIIVWDASGHLPARKDVSAGAESGRGLVLVEAMSDAWGWFRGDQGDGKFVWAITK